MRPAVNGENGRSLIAVIDLCMEIGADAVAMFTKLGDADRAAACARRCVRMAKLFGLYEEERRR